MKNWIFFIFLFICAILEPTIFYHLRLLHVQPNLLLACVVYSALEFSFGWALFFGIFAGIFRDAFLTLPFGINTVLFPLWIFCIRWVSKKINLEDTILRYPLLFLIVILHSIVQQFALIFLAEISLSGGIFFRIVLL